VNSAVEILRGTYCNIDVDVILDGPPNKRLASIQQCPGAWTPSRALLEIETVHLIVSENSTSKRETSSIESSGIEGSSTSNDPPVRCISVRVEGDLDLDAFNRWVLRTLKDFTILRAKGVLAAEGYSEKLAFQAVHAAFHGTPSLTARWKPGEARYSDVVLIGCNIPQDLIEYGLRRCLASSQKPTPNSSPQ